MNKKTNMNQRWRIKEQKSKPKLRPAKDIINRLLWDKSYECHLESIYVGYFDKIDKKIYHIAIKDWKPINKGGDIPEYLIEYFKLKNDNKSILLWDKKSRLDTIFGSGQTHKSQLFTINLLNNTNNNNNNNNNIEKKENFIIKKPWSNYANTEEPGGLCKFYAAGWCAYGKRCDLIHDSNGMKEYRNKWLQCKTEYPLAEIKFNPYSMKKQIYDYILVLDLEGKDEIIEFPCILIDLKKMKEISRYHRFVIPKYWYMDIKNKKLGNKTIIKTTDNACFNWETNAVPFEKCFKDLFIWLNKYDIKFDKNGYFTKDSKKICVSICGNWDIKTQIPKQCNICNIELPRLFEKWINIKDFALSLYKGSKAYQVKGMKPLLRYLGMKLYGLHHLGMDDTYNISCIVLRFIKDGGMLVPTAKKDFKTGRVSYTFKNRVNRSTT